jgi:hypothetical protein
MKFQTYTTTKQLEHHLLTLPEFESLYRDTVSLLILEAGATPKDATASRKIANGPKRY